MSSDTYLEEWVNYINETEGARRYPRCPWIIDPLYPELPAVHIERGNSFAGTKIVESPHATERYEDWSRVRSPARAARRRQRGFRQNIVERIRPAAFEINGVLYAHPDLVTSIAQAAGDKTALNKFYGNKAAR